MTGKVIRIPNGKAFGFIQCDRKDYFFHRDDFHGDWQALTQDLLYGPSKGVEVTFDVAHSTKGPRAENVVRV